jgi:hypothetical protein
MGVEMESTSVPISEPVEKSVARILITIANLEYEIIRSKEGDYLAFPRTGPKISKPLNSEQYNFGGDLMRRYMELTGKIPSERAINDAIRVLINDSHLYDPVPVYLRNARLGEFLYIDLGDSTGRAVEIKPGSWSIIERPPVYFRRTNLTGRFPTPIAGGEIHKLFTIVNIPSISENLIIGWLIASMDPSIPRPILGVNGEQGSGKTFTSKHLSYLVDPSPAPLQSPPRDESAWIEAAANSYCVSLDNLSKISNEFSDSLCRAATGIASSKRKLYSDKGVVVYDFKNTIIINGINLAIVRDDLSDRVLPIYLPIISSKKRNYESDLEKQWNEMYPYIFGGLLDLCAKVLLRIPHVKLKHLPRMADFARILEAMDEVIGTNSFGDFISEIDKSADISIKRDAFLTAITEAITADWRGTARELLDVLVSKIPTTTDRSWPSNNREVTEKLTRSAPTLRKLGWTVTNLGSNNHQNATRWNIAPPASHASVISTF